MAFLSTDTINNNFSLHSNLVKKSQGELVTGRPICHRVCHDHRHIKVKVVLDEIRLIDILELGNFLQVFTQLKELPNVIEFTWKWLEMVTRWIVSTKTVTNETSRKITTAIIEE